VAVLDANYRSQQTYRFIRSIGLSLVICRFRSDFLRCLCTACVLAFVASCATAPPVQEMSDARQAIAAAKEAGAEDLAFDQLNQAEVQLMRAEKYLETGGSGNYWNAQQAAINAKKIAFDALLKSRTAREAAEPETTTQ
jgi:hypothetical protein